MEVPAGKSLPHAVYFHVPLHASWDDVDVNQEAVEYLTQAKMLKYFVDPWAHTTAISDSQLERQFVSYSNEKLPVLRPC